MNRQVPAPAPVPVATSAEGCASGDCLPSGEGRGEGKNPGQPLAAPEGEKGEPEADEPEEEVAAPPRAAAPPQRQSSDEDKWRRAVDAVRDASPRHGKSLSYARFLGFSPEGVKVAFPPDAAFHRSQVIGMSRAMVEGELARSLGRPVRLIEETDARAFESASKSIAEVEATDRSARERGIAEKVKTHPALRNVIRHLGGTLEHIAYLEPVTRPSVASPTPDEGDAGPSVD